LTIKVSERLLKVIWAARAARKLKQKDCAVRYGLSPQYFSAMLSGRERWRESILDQMLNDLDILEAVKKRGLR
jgi:transcriptional regulator with XRE-family HTH domain